MEMVKVIWIERFIRIFIVISILSYFYTSNAQYDVDNYLYKLAEDKSRSLGKNSFGIGIYESFIRTEEGFLLVSDTVLRNNYLKNKIHDGDIISEISAIDVRRLTDTEIYSLLSGKLGSLLHIKVNEKDIIINRVLNMSEFVYIPALEINSLTVSKKIKKIKRIINKNIQNKEQTLVNNFKDKKNKINKLSKAMKLPLENHTLYEVVCEKGVKIRDSPIAKRNNENVIGFLNKGAKFYVQNDYKKNNYVIAQIYAWLSIDESTNKVSNPSDDFNKGNMMILDRDKPLFFDLVDTNNIRVKKILGKMLKNSTIVEVMNDELETEVNTNNPKNVASSKLSYGNGYEEVDKIKLKNIMIKGYIGLRGGVKCPILIKEK